MSAGRLAPTPSGHLHLGNITAFYTAWLSAKQSGAKLLLRIEDIDTGRARPDVEARQRACLRWLGLNWDTESPRQSERSYTDWLRALEPFTYRCTCTRAQMRADGGRCGQECREAGHTEGAVRFIASTTPVRIEDRRNGVQVLSPACHGDPMLLRRDGLVAYPLAVVVDDIRDGVTEVVRGDDLLSFSAVQEQIWAALGATPPTWLHCPLILGPGGQKLSKSHGSVHIDALREAGWTAPDILRLVGTWLGLNTADPIAAIPLFDPTAAVPGAVVLTDMDLSRPGHLLWESRD